MLNYVRFLLVKYPHIISDSPDSSINVMLIKESIMETAAHEKMKLYDTYIPIIYDLIGEVIRIQEGSS